MPDERFTISLPAGVVRNDSAYAVKGRYINSHLVHFWEGLPQKWGGWANFNNLQFTEPIRGGLVWVAYDGRALSAFGSANKLWVIKDQVKYDITPQVLTAGNVDAVTTDSGWGAGGWGSGPWGGGFSALAGQTSFPRVWTLAKWGQDLMACPRGEKIYFWSYTNNPNLGLAMTGQTQIGNDSFTKVLLHMDGTNGSTTFTESDLGGSAHTWTANGTAQISTALSKFGGASGLFAAGTDWIDTPDSADFTLGGGDFTVDVWFNCTAAGGTEMRIAGQNDSGLTATNISFSLRRTTGNVIEGQVNVGSTAFVVTGTTQFTNVLNTGFNHAALVRTGGTLKLFINGTQEGGNVAAAGTINDSGNKLAVGRRGEAAGSGWIGNLDEFRISVGIARWTANFTPPALAYGDPKTILALGTPGSVKVGDLVTGNGIPGSSYVVSVNVGASSLVMTVGATIAATGVALSFNTPAVALSTLTGDTKLPTSALGIFVTDSRELVAFGAAVSPLPYDPLNVAWCSREDYTTWTPNTTNTAGAIRAETGNQIMGAVRVFGGFLIITDLSAHPFTFIGGDDVWGLDRVGSTGGAIGPQAIVEVDGVGYWMGPAAIHSYNGRVNTVYCDVHELVYNNVNKVQAYKIYACTNRKYGLVQWFLPGTLTSIENDSFFGVNTFDNSWEIGGLIANASDTPAAAFSRTTWIDSHALFKTPLGIDGTNFKIYQHEAGSTADGVPISYMLETGELELKDQNGRPQAGDNFIRMKKVVPDFAYQTGSHSLTIEARGYPNDPPVTKGPYDMTSGGMFNPKARGRHFRFIQLGNGDFRQGDFEAYASPDGSRR